jgi:hypothetical protein
MMMTMMTMMMMMIEIVVENYCYCYYHCYYDVYLSAQALWIHEGHYGQLVIDLVLTMMLQDVSEQAASSASLQAPPTLMSDMANEAS